MKMPAASLTPTASYSGRLFYRASMVSALAIGALQMFHVRAGVLTNYGADLFGTAWLYGMTRLGWTVVQRGRPASTATAAAVILVLCAVSEVGQRTSLVPGHYDPYDILTFVIATGACLGLERALGPFVALQPGDAPPNQPLQPTSGSDANRG